jgi:hypothetical protein
MTTSTVTCLVRDGVLDADLAALCWLLLEARLPLAVIGRVPPGARLEVAGALVALRAGDMPPIVALAEPGQAADALHERVVWDAAMRRGAAVTADAASLGELLGRLQGPPLALQDDELRALSLVIVLATDAARLRVVAAHYLRPVERDGQGHLQHRPPAVLATWDPAGEGFEHFAWGVAPELAARVGRSQADLEERQAERAAIVRTLVGAGRLSGADLERSLAQVGTSRAGASTMPA